MNPKTFNRTRIKICGLTRECDLDAAVEAGADAIGFVRYTKSQRHVSIERAAELARRLPPFVTPVLLNALSWCGRIVRGSVRRWCNSTETNRHSNAWTQPATVLGALSVPQESPWGRQSRILIS